ncbi:NAD(P)H-dependent flavin oxidoreductase [Ramlibacter sp.]|uniref:NAD(P)H-dependent flavin oxidoreductase n=1 Tax=Ramlibacter sp. TaxID=1917967 RepID=UPI0035B3A43F
MPSTLDLGTPLALIQAPMAGAQDSALALAAGAAGALGSLPAAMLDAAALNAELTRMREAGRPYNVNFFTHVPPEPDAAREAAWRAALAPYYAEHGIDPASVPAGPGRRPFDAAFAEVLEVFSPPVVSFHFGLPAAPLLARVKAMGALVLSSATTVEEGLWLQANGADAVIAQGLEAGGHRGHFLQKDVALQSATLPLVQALAQALSVPVIAAGGIASAAQVRAALEAGAAAVQVGTSFLLCDEARTGALHRARLRDTAAETTLTNLFTGGLARGLFNRAMRELGPQSPLAPAFPLATAAIAPLRARAEAAGSDDFTPLWSGTDRTGCRAAPAAEVVRALAAGWAR